VIQRSAVITANKRQNGINTLAASGNGAVYAFFCQQQCAPNTQGGALLFQRQLLVTKSGNEAK
jgi:hypothetical protein